MFGGGSMLHTERLPTVNQKMFLMNKEVVILKVYSEFNLAKVNYINCDVKFVIDIHALSEYPDLANTISIRVLGGVST